LEQMAREGIPVEINLTSNEFILGVKDGEHPLLLYHAHGVPIVLSTDDAGILRTNLSQQFVVAALRYPELKYGDFKRFALDSIRYSFMPEEQKEAELLIAAVLGSLFADWEDDPAMQGAVAAYSDIISDLHEATATVAPDVSTYYQAYASRNTKDPIRVFAQLYVSFKAAAGHENLVAVNIVQAENGIYSMRDYWGHMRMFAFLKDEYAPVRTAMHAGELHLGLVPPEQLKSHIHEAVAVAGADRIGHGVSIAFEENAPELLAQMAREGIPVEINLTSNEFILGVKDGEHPLLLYHAHGVPIVLSTDDAGILRTNLSQQFVVAALRYPKLEYGDFKRFALDSIRYSFMPEEQKEAELLKLNQAFAIFEESFAP